MFVEENEYKYSDLTHKIIGCAMSVHSFLGNGFQEVIYQRALAYELTLAGLGFSREIEMEIFYKDKSESIGTRRVDFLIENKVLVELKATTQITDIHYAQIINYLTAYKLEIGLLINFGEKSLTFKRFIKSLADKSAKLSNQ
jgi:GxxExxY protein